MFKTYAEIQKASFAEQVLAYRSHPTLGLNMMRQQLLSDLDEPGIRAKHIEKIETGQWVPDDQLVERLADVFMLWPSLHSRDAKFGCREAFFLAAHKARSVQESIANYSAMREPISERALATELGINPSALLRYRKGALPRDRENALQLAAGLKLHGEAYDDFLRKAGNFFADEKALFKAMQSREVPISEAFNGLCQILHGTIDAAMSKMSIPRTEYKHFSRHGSGRRPSRERMHFLVGRNGFDFTRYGDEERKRTELFFESAGYAIDIAHVAKMLGNKKISLYGNDQAVSQLVSMNHPSGKACAEAAGVMEYVVTDWQNDHIPRARLLNLISSGKEEDQRLILRSAGYFLTGADIFSEYRQSNRLHDMLDDFKTTFDLNDNQLGVGEGTIKALRNTYNSPRPETLARIFLALCRHEAGLDIHWDDYKRIAGRFLGYSGGYAYSVFERQMDSALAGLQRQAELA